VPLDVAKDVLREDDVVAVERRALVEDDLGARPATGVITSTPRSVRPGRCCSAGWTRIAAGPSRLESRARPRVMHGWLRLGPTGRFSYSIDAGVT
jgi:hypothetical protein